MIDIHCHILPGIDDGAASWETSVEMCRMAAEDGTTHIVATPHANDHYSYDRTAHEALLEHLRELTGGTPELSLGCDFHFSYDNVQDLLADRMRFTIGQGKFLLVELSDYAIPPRFQENLRQLISVGLQPIITHPERNPLLQQHPEPVLDWVEAGALVQVTANSLSGFWGKRSQAVARWLLDCRAVHVVASDGHDTKRRPPVLSAVRQLVAEWNGEAIAHALFEANPAAIVKGTDVPSFPPLIR
jgi:protein-tyrosine phosphatase